MIERSHHHNFPAKFPEAMWPWFLQGGGFKNLLNVQPWGNGTQFDLHIFEIGGEKPPARIELYKL